jgi:hypothetical protein
MPKDFVPLRSNEELRLSHERKCSRRREPPGLHPAEADLAWQSGSIKGQFMMPGERPIIG